MDFLKKNIIFSTLVEVYHLLLPGQRLNALKVMILILFSSLLDILGLASILPVLYMVLDNSLIHNNVWINKIYLFFGFESENVFLFCMVSILLFIFIIKNVFSVFIVYYQSKFCYGIATNFSLRQCISYYSKGFLFFKNTNSNEIFRDIDMLPTGYTVTVMLPFLQLLSEGIVLLIIVISLSWVKAELFILLVLLLVPAFLIPYQLLKEKVYKAGEKYTRLVPESGKNMFQLIMGYVDVKLFGREDFFIKKYISSKSSLNSIQAQLYTLDAIPIKLVELITIFGIVIIFAFTIFWGNDRRELILILGLFFAAAYRVMPSLSRILNSLMKIKGWKYSTSILQNLSMNNVINVVGNAESEKLLFTKQINFENISFNYPEANQFTVRNISLTIKKGESIGFIGRSGSGKSSLMNILLRFLKEQEGKITVDDVCLSDQNTHAWRNLIGYVKQEIFLVDGSLIDNIAYGVEPKNIDFEKVKEAISLANLDEFVRSLPTGFYTQIGEFGNKISGGQKQRISIARALYKNAEILILDEATNQLDNQTEKEITESIEKLSQKGITMFIIAHRLSTLKNCHRIYIMDNGEIKNSYSFQELQDKQ